MISGSYWTKRIPQLRQLSDDHHQGLVLGRLARHAVAGTGDATPEKAWAEITHRFATELDPHFRVEEESLIPALEAIGEQALVNRLRLEHAELRKLCSGHAGMCMDTLQRIGALLEQHIRFEERELFPLAQERLSAEALEGVRLTREHMAATDERSR